MPDAIIASTPRTLRVHPTPRMTRWLLRGDPAAVGAAVSITLPTQPCTAAQDGERNALWLGPDEWLLLAPEDASLSEWDGPAGAAIDVGHRHVGYVLEGPAVELALAVACPLDLSPAAFPIGTCTRTIFGKAEIILWRRGADTFHIEVWRSFAPYVRTLLSRGELDAAGAAPCVAEGPE